jgi:hypothetical protein
MDGEKLRKYIDKLGLGMSEWLAMTEFGQNKMYSLFKQFEIKERDKIQLKKDFKLPDDFFETEKQINILAESEVKYERILSKIELSMDEREELAGLREKVEGMRLMLIEKERLITILENQLKKNPDKHSLSRSA